MSSNRTRGSQYSRKKTITFSPTKSDPIRSISDRNTRIENIELEKTTVCFLNAHSVLSNDLYVYIYLFLRKIEKIWHTI